VLGQTAPLTELCSAVIALKFLLRSATAPGSLFPPPATVSCTRWSPSRSRRNLPRASILRNPHHRKLHSARRSDRYKAAQKDLSLPVPSKQRSMFISNANTLPTRTWAFPVSRSLLPRPRTPSTRACKPSTPTNFQRRKSTWGEALKLAPGHPDVLFLQGVLDSVSTIGRRRKQCSKNPRNSIPTTSRLRGTGHSPHEPGQIRAAIPPLEKSLQLQPTGWETQWTLAKAYYHQQQYDARWMADRRGLARSPTRENCQYQTRGKPLIHRCRTNLSLTTE